MAKSLIGLAVTFFLYSYKPLDIVRDEDEQLDILKDEDEQLGFLDSITLKLLPKVMWLSLAISTIGLLFYSLDFGNGSYKNMLIIGGLTIGIALFFIGLAI